jgi:hypothetical protein
MIWSIFTYLFCYSTTGGCMFMTIDGFLLSLPPYSTFGLGGEHSHVGLFAYQASGTGSSLLATECTLYTPLQLENFMDAPLKAARAFAMIANICNGVVMLFGIAMACVAYKRVALCVIASFSALGGVSLCLTLALFGSKLGDDPYNGSFSVGAGLAIVAILCSILTTVLILNIPLPEEVGNYTVSSPASSDSRAINTTGKSALPVYQGRNFAAPARASAPETAPGEGAFQPGTETTTEAILPDGSKKIIKTTIGLDGSKTISETIVSTS